MVLSFLGAALLVVATEFPFDGVEAVDVPVIDTSASRGGTPPDLVVAGIVMLLIQRDWNFRLFAFR